MRSRRDGAKLPEGLDEIIARIGLATGQEFEHHHSSGHQLAMALLLDQRAPSRPAIGRGVATPPSLPSASIQASSHSIPRRV